MQIFTVHKPFSTVGVGEGKKRSEVADSIGSEGSGKIKI